MLQRKNSEEENTHLRDNHQRGTVGAFLQENIAAGSSLSIVSAYFTIYAFAELKSKLINIEGMRFLFGEPHFIKSIDPSKTEIKAFRIEEDGLKRLKDSLKQSPIAKDCADWIKQKVQIKSIRQSNFLHGKMYLMNDNDVAILGSSNFTLRGLGLSNTPNLELNIIIDSEQDRRDLKAWFDALWDDEKWVKDVTADVLEYLEQLYLPTAPEFVYYKTLYHLFKKFLEEQANMGILEARTHFYDTQIWNKLYDFQQEGVKIALAKLNKHNGCIIADSVGLGKTFEALAVIKHFESLNYNVLVLCPKKLRQNWTKYNNTSDKRNPFTQDRFRYTVLSHTDLSRDSGKVGDIDLKTIDWGAFDLVVIDESHNFRNNTADKKDELGQVIRKSRYNRLLDDIIKKEGVAKTKVLLLSATPVNTDLKDLRNQLAFFTEGQDNAFQESLGIQSIKSTLDNAQKCFKEWAEPRGARHKNVLLEKLGSDFFKLLDELTIARSRKHLEQYFQATILKLGQFPERLPPIAIFSEIDVQKQFLSYQALNEMISKYKLAVFNPSAYVRAEYQDHYKIKQSRQQEHYLIGMMKVNFLKRLESAVYAFALTMERTVIKIEALEQKITRFKTAQSENPSFDFAELNPEKLDDEELKEALQIGQKLVFKFAHLDVDAWLDDLQEDKAQLQSLHDAAKTITIERDAKLAKLKQLIANKVRQPTTDKDNKANRKILVFTAFADTAIYLYEALETWATKELSIHIAMVSGHTHKTTFGKHDFEDILMHFSPRSKERDSFDNIDKSQEIDLLIATDCISEGQNLQDCDYLINYDIHWNPVRIIQRFGRIDRLNSRNQTVQLVNFWPTEDLEDYINLKDRVEARMALVDIAATSKDNLLTPEEAQEELSFRDQQLKRLKTEILDLEDFDEGVTLNEFTLDDFRVELNHYLEQKKRQLEQAPYGLYAIVPPYHEISPCVIFCLEYKAKQLTQKKSQSENINPLHPFFLVYVLDNGSVKYNFTRPKETLLIFQKLCVGKTEAYQDLCRLFDRETKEGASMELYNNLLEQAVASIVRLFKKRHSGNLFAGRGGKLLDAQQQIKNTEDFELISWLIVTRSPNL
ncbi:helicase-related protein [Candidatus Parabeggiatoa sp. HSG14]|uniref:helicase-related protein n=1 Tax=Candidatus Parabeggiatoa sp. HSG14 TaxID=3055593 RepID=UPI0025A81280|nr:helicase-related protein [Thiotrichales bacterium HSG14]